MDIGRYRAGLSKLHLVTDEAAKKAAGALAKRLAAAQALVACEVHSGGDDMAFTVAVKFDFRRYARKKKAEAKRVFVEEATRLLQGISDVAVGQWRVDTGRSRAGFDILQSRKGRAQVVSLINPVEYTGLIVHGEDARRLLFQPFDRETAKLGQRIIQRLAGK